MIKRRKKAKVVKTNKQIMVGAVVGTFIGAIAGVMTAPKTGKETRKDITEKGKEKLLKLKKQKQTNL